MPDEFEAKALDAVKSDVAIVDAAPVIAPAFASSWVCIADVTPFKYWNSASDTVPFAIFSADIPVGIESFVFDNAPI